MSLITATYTQSKVWRLIAEGMNEIRAKTGVEWDGDYLIQQLDTGRIRAFFALDLTGFVLLAVQHEYLTGEPVLYVVAAYSSRGDAMKAFQFELEEIAKEIGAIGIRFQTIRKSLVRYSKQFGYAEESTGLIKRI